MLRKARVAGWGLLALALVVLAAVVTVGALQAHGDAAFNRWVGWATVAALPVAAVGVVLVLWEKIAPNTASGELNMEENEAELAAVVLAQAQIARSRLIGADQAADQPANVRFVKSSSRFREVGGPSEGDLATVLAYYQSLSPSRMVVLGEPGAGKTVLAMELLIGLLEYREHDTSIPIPVLISAAAYDARLGWEDWLAQHLALRFSLGATASTLVRDGRILPVVDGLDEMDPTGGDPERARTLVTALNASMRGRERAPIVVTCRHREYQALVRKVDRATHIEMISLTGPEAADYLCAQFLSQDEQDRWEPVLAGLDADPHGPLAGQLATPWRLTLALAVFRDTGDPADLLPPLPALTSAATEEYTRQVDRLLLGGYVSSAVHLHDPTGRYTVPQVQQWLTALADGLAWQAHHSKSATDIQLGQWWQPTGRRVTRLAHIALAVIFALIPIITGVTSNNSTLLAAGGVLVLASPTAGLSFSPDRLKVRQMTTRSVLAHLGLDFMVAVTCWLVVGLVLGLVSWLAFGVTKGIAFGLAIGLGAGVVNGLVTGLTGALADDSPIAVGPRDVIRADGLYGLVLGLALSFVVAFLLVLVGKFIGTRALVYVDALIIGIGTGFAFGFGVMANAWARYHITVVLIAARQHGPLRFGAFLDWAQQAGLLRVSGVAYQFRHSQLQNWLTVTQRRPPEY
jgi:hypothetical protein